MIELSIIIPIYNTEIAKLKRCFESVKRIQTTFYECLLVDDGSMEEIKVFLSEYAQHTPCFRYIRKDNGGVSSSRNLGIDKTRGKYICFVDSDDEIVPEAYGVFLSRENDSDLIFSDLLLIDRDKKARWKACDSKEITYEKMLRRVLVNGKVNGPCCKFIKREFLCRTGIRFHEDMVTAEDLMFLLDMLDVRPSMTYIDEVSYFYFREKSTGLERLKKHLGKHFANYKATYLKEMSCISKGEYSSEEKEELNLLSAKKLVMSMFNTTLEAIESNIKPQVIEKGLFEILDTLDIDIKNSDMKTRIRMKLLMAKRWRLLGILAAFRRKYLKVKGMI